MRAPTAEDLPEPQSIAPAVEAVRSQLEQLEARLRTLLDDVDRTRKVLENEERPLRDQRRGHRVALCLPNGAFALVQVSDAGAHEAKTWGITEHEDGTITLTPSLLLTQPGVPGGDWHGFLERGVWRAV